MTEYRTIGENGGETIYELLPCPFCGAPAHVWQDTNGARVQCSAWQVVHEPVHCVSVGGKTLQEAVDAWNDRFGENALAYAFEQLRRDIENNMEQIVGIYNSATPEHLLPSHKCERNNGRKECLALLGERWRQALIDAHTEKEGGK